MEEIKVGDKIIDIWGNEKTVINTDCGGNTWEKLGKYSTSDKLYEYEDGKYIVAGNIDRVIKK